MSDLKGKTALVTGGNSGIGRAVAVALARNGAHVVLSGRDADRGEQAVATIREAGGPAEFVRRTSGTRPAPALWPGRPSGSAAGTWTSW